MNTPEFFGEYTKAYDRVMSSLPTYMELVNLHRESLKSKTRVLESGCGTGILAVELLRQGSEVYAMVQNQKALDILRTKTRSTGYENRLKIYCQDVHELPFDDEFFDGVSSMLVLPFMDEPTMYLREHARVLKKGGVFVVSGPDQKSREDVDRIMKEWEGKVKRGLLGNLTEDWEKFEKYTKSNVSENVRNWFDIKQLSRILEVDIGLQVKSQVTNPIYGSGYVITAKKKID